LKCGIQSIDSLIDKGMLDNLETLELSYDYILITPAFKKLKNLRKLYYSFNKIKSIFVLTNLPDNLTHLTLETEYLKNIINTIDINLKYLHIICKYGTAYMFYNIPPNLEYFDIEIEHIIELESGVKIDLNFLPDSLTFFRFNQKNDHHSLAIYEIKSLPKNLKRLYLTVKNYGYDTLILPTGLKYFYLRTDNEDSLFKKWDINKHRDYDPVLEHVIYKVNKINVNLPKNIKFLSILTMTVML